MKIIKSDSSQTIKEAVKTLKAGGILIYPTETCYGVGVDATNIEAVTNVLEYKKRPAGKPISVGISSLEMAKEYVEINKNAENIYNELLPGPITVVSKSLKKVDVRLESENGNLGIRYSSNKLLQKIINEFGKPITTTSANTNGKKTPYSVDDILNNINEKQKELIGLIIDFGELPKNKPSTVIDTTTDKLKTYRGGDVNIKEDSRKVTTNSYEETIKLGSELMSENINSLKDTALLFKLSGDLGAGKTHFVKGIARALEVEKNIKSPTYTYVSEYKLENKNKLYHLDAWRLKSALDVEALEIGSWFKKGNVIAIEWPGVLKQLEFDFKSNSKIIEIFITAPTKEKRNFIIND
ncbi:MAG: L-threonylcarbamoyladenylate synthase [Candidatus Dojkabacteria bacterium]|nr:L-threonylcarbamoyladenylate synthase [Candidatus Dojkabacteria bacterium]MDQ7021671.1 L-threonylcarbamoyladenylate synthase [Candidatus Dojkabacteria bacterium]